ncbi:MAG: DegV family protein [Oscillospiraceae bacterium]|jgi:DegV family protein with EDD domain|nr:DegV family protein [Oscillospiraceae bacterium]
MSDYVILTESTADLSKEQILNLGVKVDPLSFNIGGNNYKNNLGSQDLTPKEFYNLLREGVVSKTSQINTAQFLESFEEILKKGKDILYLGFSSALSGTYASSLLAKKELSSKYPNRKIITIDTLCASGGEGLIVYLATQNKKRGFSLEENAEFVEKNKLNVCHWFIVDSLDHLRRGGRISQASAFLGNMLGIRPILHVDNYGKLSVVQKVRGKKIALNKIADRAIGSFFDGEDSVIFICHADAKEDADYIAELISSNCRRSNNQIFISSIGPVIGSHTGPGTIALFFMGNER